MAKVPCNISAHFLSAVILVVILSEISPSDAVDTNCTCHNIDSNFDETIKAEVHHKCRKCYRFPYDFTPEQNWTARVCVSSKQASLHSPILVVVREYISVLSFSVPQTPEGENNCSFTDVCHTLCPLANYFDEKLHASKQNIYVEVTSQNEVPVDFEVRLSKIHDFIIATDQSLTVNITPSQPQVMQYNMEKDIDSVRVEAISSDSSCMVLAIQDIQCPFSDFESTMPHYSGFYQTLMTQSGITISREFFPMGRVYVVLLLKATNEDCRQCCESDDNQSKEVTVIIVPPISGTKFGWGIALPVVIYIFFYFIAFCYYCCCRRVSLPAIWLTCCKEKEDKVLPRTVDQFKEEGYLDTGNICYVSDVAEQDEVDLIKRSELYIWNLGTVAIFYFLPVFQLVYLNQKIVNLTGNQDLCYYNFLCSHRFGIFSDFNHIWSNIGYIMLGILFIFIVLMRDIEYKKRMSSRCHVRKEEMTGICNFGLYYAMGLTLVMEGLLSACYHVCPSRNNFQFDTTFMYVLCVLSMLKMYQSRHPDSVVQSHAAWVILACVIVLSFFGTQSGELAYWIILIWVDIGHLIIVSYVISKIYFVKSWKRGIGRMETVKHDWKHKHFRRHNRTRLILLILAALINICLIICAGVLKLSIPMCILLYLLVNLICYMLYYMSMKIANEGGLPWYSVIYFLVAFVMWGVAIYYFCNARAKWEITPAQSREINEHCISGLDFYDDHDIWHLCSSIAIFFSYLVPFTLDDNLEETYRKEIIVF